MVDWHYLLQVIFLRDHVKIIDVEGLIDAEPSVSKEVSKSCQCFDKLEIEYPKL